MNLKERGITVGDLLIILIVILTTTIFFKAFNKDKKTTLNIINHEEILMKRSLLSTKHFNYLNFFDYLVNRFHK